MTTSRRAANRKAWSDRIERFKLANQSVAEFCVSEGIAPANFYQWRRQLGASAAVANAVPRFIPVQLPRESTFEAQEAQISTVMSIELPGGIFIRFDLAGRQGAQP